MKCTRNANRGLSRRQFIQATLAGGAAALLGKRASFAMDEIAPDKTDVWVFHGEDKEALMKACLRTISDNGGFFDGARKLTLKVNAAWIRKPNQGANTHPQLVETFLNGCKDQGITELLLPEYTCDKATESFAESGILDAAKNAGARMINLQTDKHLFKDVEVPDGKNLKTARVAVDFLETDVLVNMPVAKHHGAAAMTCAMKNWMGAVEERGLFHQNNLHQCIADSCTVLRPQWTIVDATRIMLDRGPKGPTTNMNIANLLIVSRDQVAADAYAASLFPDELRKKMHFLDIAGEMKIGMTDLSQMDIHRIEVG